MKIVTYSEKGMRLEGAKIEFLATIRETLPKASLQETSQGVVMSRKWERAVRDMLAKTDADSIPFPVPVRE